MKMECVTSAADAWHKSVAAEWFWEGEECAHRAMAPKAAQS